MSITRDIFLTPLHFRIISRKLRISLQIRLYSTAQPERFTAARAPKFGTRVEPSQNIVWLKFQNDRTNIASVRGKLAQASIFESLKSMFLDVYLSYRGD